MFTGLIQELGNIEDIQSSGVGMQVMITASDSLCDALKVGGSIAVDGVCLTATEVSENYFKAFISTETSNVTTLSTLQVSSSVNLELCLTLAAPIGGHLVTGHVDGIAEVVAISDVGSSKELYIEFPERLSSFVAKKGSITLAGVSLTVNAVTNNIATLMIIPHTLENTNLKSLVAGARINMEVDLLARYCAKILDRELN